MALLPSEKIVVARSRYSSKGASGLLLHCQSVSGWSALNLSYEETLRLYRALESVLHMKDEKIVLLPGEKSE